MFASQSFKSRIAAVNDRWLGDQLGMARQQTGIDLLDGTYGVEVKSKHAMNQSKFPVHDYQRRFFPRLYRQHRLFWAFLIYTVEENPKILSPLDYDEIIKRIERREVWIIDWHFVNAYPKSRYAITGPYRYVPKSGIFRLQYNDYQVPGGLLHFQKGVSLEERMKIPF